MSVVASRPQTAGSCRLYLRCLLWGIATGAATGAAIGGVLGVMFGLGDTLSDDLLATLVGLPLTTALPGLIVGALVAVIPSTLGALVVTTVLERRHPPPCSPDAVQRDVGVIFCALVASIDVPMLVAIFAGEGLSSIVVSAPLIMAGNAVVVGMLWRARTSITRAWSKDNEQTVDRPLSGTWYPAP